MCGVKFVYHDDPILLLLLGIPYLPAVIPLQIRMQMWNLSEPVEACRRRVSYTVYRATLFFCWEVSGSQGPNKAEVHYIQSILLL